MFIDQNHLKHHKTEQHKQIFKNSSNLQVKIHYENKEYDFKSRINENFVNLSDKISSQFNKDYNSLLF
jgi:hypothetical protein